MESRVGALLLPLALLSGCRAGDGEATDRLPPMPSIDLAAGRADPRLAGVWKSPEELYSFAPDGTFKLHFDRMEQTGPSKSSKVRRIGDMGGRWSSTGKELLLSVDQGENGAKHRMTLVMHEGGGVMELRPTFMKKGAGTLYRRVK